MKIKVTISNDGKLTLITQEGDFQSGKTTLEALLGALRAQGIEATQIGQVETHRHDLQMITTGEALHSH